MSIETGVLVNLAGEPIHWHLPPGRSSAYLPDSKDLWDIIFENRDNLLGFAHSHPGGGLPSPSWEDITTFSAVELGLGKRLDWWIISQTDVCIVRWVGPEKYQYFVEPIEQPEFLWLNELKKLSYF